jgi:hypothetical protein
MGYIESNLLSDENIVYKAKLHSIILWKACALIFLGIVFLIIQPIVAAIVIAARDIGLVVGNQSGQFCLSIANANLKRGQDVTLVWLPIAEEKQVPELRSATVQKALMNPAISSTAFLAMWHMLWMAANSKRAKSISPSWKSPPTRASFTEEAKSK